MSFCTHLDHIHNVEPQTAGCPECIEAGYRWVHLRQCLECGHVGCCDDSIGRHATKHFQQTLHPIMKSIQPGESWAWCYVDQISLNLD